MVIQTLRKERPHILPGRWEQQVALGHKTLDCDGGGPGLLPRRQGQWLAPGFSSRGSGGPHMLLEGRGRGCCLVLGPLVVRVHTCSQGGRGSHWCLVSGPSRAAAVNACDCLWGQRWQWQLILAIGTPLDGALLPESMSLEEEAPVVVPPLSL